MQDFAWFIVLALAVWRISSLLVREDGPFELLAKFRRFIGVRYDENSRPYGKNILAELFICVWCLSVWISLLSAWASSYAVNIHTYIFTALALSALAIVIDGITRK